MNNIELERLSLYNEVLEARIAELKEERDNYDAEAAGYWEVIKELQQENSALHDRRKANLDWIAGLVAAAYTQAKRTGAGEEALEELEDLQDIVDETVARMLSED